MSRNPLPLETRVVGALLLAGLIAAPWLGSKPQAASSTERTSLSAMTVAHEIQDIARELDYDDPRLAQTVGFEIPHESLRSRLESQPGYRATWEIVDDEPARRMKTIRVRVRWAAPHDGGQELSLVTIKAS